MNSWTQEQQTAITTPHNVLVMAGAGTGKTRTMTERIVRTLDSIEGLHQLLVVTFTEDAASEVRHRIYQALLERIRSVDGIHRMRYEALRDQFPEHYISTMHTFFAHLLRRFGHHLPHFDPDFTIVEGAEQHRLLRESIETVLDRIAQDPKSPLRESLARWLIHGDRRRVAAAIGVVVRRRIELRPWLERYSTESLEVLFREYQAWAENFLNERRAAFFGDPEVARAIETLRRETPDPSGGTDSLIGRSRAVLHAYDAEDLSALRCCLLRSDGTPCSFHHIGQKALWDLDARKAVREALGTIAERIAADPFLGWEWDPDQEYLVLELAQDLARLTQAALDHYQERKRRRHVLDFVDLEDFASRLVRERPRIRAALHRQFRAIFIDEFQDTNRHQWEIFRAIAADPRTGKIPPGRVFLVGDEKQAIYEFRGGEVEVCRLVERELDQLLQFTGNFRSGPNLLLFTNAFFDRLLTDTAPYEARPQPLRYRDEPEPPQAARPGGGTVRRWVLRSARSSPARSELRREAFFLAQRLREILDGRWEEEYPGIADRAARGEPTIGILFRRSSYQQLYEEALRAYGVPFVTARGRGFFQRQEVRDLRNVLQFLADPEDDLALVGALRSPIVGCSDLGLVRLRRFQEREAISSFWKTLLRLARTPANLERWLGEDAPAAEKAVCLFVRWQRCAEQDDLGSLLARIVAESGLVAALATRPNGDQEIRNVEKFIDIARRFEESGFPTLRDFLAYLESQDEGDEEGDADLPEGGAVQLLTVHRAKGLEWPLVIVPDTGSPFQTTVDTDEPGRRGRRRVGVAIEQVGEGDVREYTLAVRPPQGARDGRSFLWSYLSEIRSRRTIAEQKRLLYVAFTRAAEHLIFCSVNYRRESAASLDEARSWSDWIAAIFAEPSFREAVAPFTTEEEVPDEDLLPPEADGSRGEPVMFREEDLRPIPSDRNRVLITEVPVDEPFLDNYPYESELPFLAEGPAAFRDRERLLNLLVPLAWRGVPVAKLSLVAEDAVYRLDAILEETTPTELAETAVRAADWTRSELPGAKRWLWNRSFCMSDGARELLGQLDLLVCQDDGWVAVDWKYGSPDAVRRWNVAPYMRQSKWLRAAAQQVLGCSQVVLWTVVVGPDVAVRWLVDSSG